MIVCVCRGVTDRAIDGAIRAGARDVAAISRATGAGTECGCCKEALAARLAAHAAAACSSPPCAGCPRAEARRSQAA